MNIEPAHVDQVRRGVHGRMVTIDADVCGVAADLKQIDPGLRVRFAESADPPVWIVFHESEDRRSTYLVLSVQAYQGPTGAWMGLDQRIVDRIREIDSEGYDYAKELERQQRKVKADQKYKFRERVGELAEEGAHGIRRAQGVKSRVFVP